MSSQSCTLSGYEPHTNLSINMKNADECRSLSDLRYEIDTIDHLIVKLIRSRMDYALATLKFKLDGKPIPDNGRIIQQLSQRRKWAEKYGLDPKFIESFFKSMIDWYMSQQIAHYKTQHPNEATIQVKICSLAELKAMEFGLNWIDISHYGQLVSSGYRKAREIAEPVLISYTQKTSIFSDKLHSTTAVNLFSLFEQSRRLSFSHGFLLAQPSQQFFMLALGSAQQFDINGNMLHLDSMIKEIADLTPQEFHSKVKEIIQGGWKRLLLNGVIENCVGRNGSGHGPVLTGGLCFDHQNKYRSGKWSRFGDTSFVLPRVQFSHERGDTYMTLNTVVTNNEKLDQEMQSIDSEIISLLEFCHELLKGTNQYADDISNPTFDRNYNTELNPESELSSDTWKQTVRDAIVNITDGNLEKVMLVHETEIKTGPHKAAISVAGSLTHLCALYPSANVFGVLRQGCCFFGTASAPLVRLLENQLEVAVLTSTTMKKNSENDDKQQREYSLMIDWIQSKLQSIVETNFLVAPDNLAALNVRGTIRRETTLLDLVQTLHPTSAVSGFPQSNAMKFIREKENLDRGWFAAPIGWIDAHNSGEFVVSLISALTTTDSTSVFAGCDIVATSDPEDKLQETMLKLKTMLSALGEK